MFVGQDIVTSRDAGAAVKNGPLGIGVAEAFPQRCFGAHRPLAQVFAEGQVFGSFDVAGYGIDRFLLAPVARRGAAVDQSISGVLADGFHPRGVDGQLRAYPRHESPGEDIGDDARQVAALGFPGGDAPIQHGNAVVAQPAQQPPQAGGDGPPHIVVGDHLRLVVDAPGTEAGGQLDGVGQRVAPRLAGDDLPRKVFVQVSVNGIRQVPLRVGAPARLRVGQRKPGIHDAQRTTAGR